ncbi:putative secondary metabolism biosynthetic enzyme [Lepraria neglecta]|uniref:Secondary metabolism biosynthetic enzyme n=1 Tax=Lepraria neglecta TaxID=209136 RepID=A0AAD9Z367_9LECA|nr:putative secondary metabolism biosynthetic enzyme [Lepraria neglecta]
MEPFKKYWHETRASREAQSLPSPRHDLLGTRVSDSSVLEPQWKNMLRADEVPWLRDHRVQELTVFPMAAYLCMGMEACRQQASWRDANYDRILFREISVHQALSIPESTPVELRLSLAPYAEGPRMSSDKWSEFKIYSWTNDRDWLKHCRGLVASEHSKEQNNPVNSVAKAQHRSKGSVDDLDPFKNTCSNPADAASIYSMVAEAGFDYGPTFRHMEDVIMGPSVVRYKATVPDSAALMPCCHESVYIIHPITLDVIFQSVWPLIINGRDSLNVPYMPIAIREMTVSTTLTVTPGAAHQVIAQMEEADKFSKKLSINIDTFDMQNSLGTPDVVIRGLIMARYKIPSQERMTKKLDVSRHSGHHAFHTLTSVTIVHSSRYLRPVHTLSTSYGHSSD